MPARALLLVLVMGSALLLYAKVWNFAETSLDDKPLIIDNMAFLRDAGNLGRAFRESYFKITDGGSNYYRPLVTASFILDAQWNAQGLRAYHVTNVVLHAIVCALLVLLFQACGFRASTALWAGLIFAVHPVFAEVVAWVPGRNDSLLAVWILASWLFALKYFDSASPVDLTAHLAFFALAILTKESAVALPLIILAQRRRWTSSASIGWAAILLVFFLVRSRILVGHSSENFFDRLQVAWHASPALLAGFGKIIFPVHLAPIAIARDTPLWPGILALGLVAVFAGATRAYRDKRFALGAGIFFLFLLPTLPVSDALILENRLYLPAVGVLFMLAVMVEAVNLPKFAAQGLAIVSITVLAVLCWRYSEVYRNRLTFGEAAVRTSPHSGLAHLNLGTTYHTLGRLTDAQREYRAALEANPSELVVHNNYGLILMGENRLKEADEMFQKEISLNPTYDKAFYNRGLLMKRLNRPGEAELLFEKAVAINPNNIEAVMELFMATANSGQTQRAAEYRRRLEQLGVMMRFQIESGFSPNQ